MKRFVVPLSLLVLAACGASGEPATSAAPIDIEAAVAARADAVAALPGTSPDAEFMAELRGRYVRADGAALHVVVGENEIYMRAAGVAMAPIRMEEAFIIVWWPAAEGFVAEDLYSPAPSELDFRGAQWALEHGAAPAEVAPSLAPILGTYLPSPGRDGATPVYLLQWEGRLWLQIGTAFMIPAAIGPMGLELGANSLGLAGAAWSDSPEGEPGFELAGTTYRRELGIGAGPTFKIDPVRPVDDLRREAMAAAPPAEAADLRSPDLTELVDVVPGLQLDIRYASTNNFMGATFYAEPRAFLQRPAAEALVAVQQRLAERGLGLLIYDAYRPWFATKMFWDATPESQRHFVADPSRGSRHNRGAAVDLTLVDLATGEPVAMTGGYDEFTERSYPFYPGGTDLQRWHRSLLRTEMQAAGFAVYEYEWWHFDYRDWAQYPILDVPFDSLDASQ